MLHTTFRLLHAAGACEAGYRRVAKAAGGVRDYGQDTPIPLIRVLEVGGLCDALWCLRAVLPGEERRMATAARLLACEFAEHVLPLFEAQYPADRRPRQAIEAARKAANELGDGQVLPLAAADAAADAALAPLAAAYAYAASAASAAFPDASAAYAAAAYAYAASAAAYAAEREWQTLRFVAMLSIPGAQE